MEKGLIIIPTYNEKENIASLLETILADLPKVEVLVVDDSSPDGTIDEVKTIIKKFKNRLYLKVRPTKEGLGAAYLEGFKWALERKYNYVFE